MNSPFAQPFLKLRAEAPGADTIQMEIALDHGIMIRQKILETLLKVIVVSICLKMEADLVNFLTIFRSPGA